MTTRIEKKIEELFLTENCLLNIEGEILSAFKIIKTLWWDNTTLKVLGETEQYFKDTFTEQHRINKNLCTNPCQVCFGIIYSILKKMEKIGLDQVFIEQVLLRQKLKNENTQ